MLSPSLSVGVKLLLGIVVKNLLFIVDFGLSWLVWEGAPLEFLRETAIHSQWR